VFNKCFHSSLEKKKVLISNDEKIFSFQEQQMTMLISSY